MHVAPSAPLQGSRYVHLQAPPPDTPTVPPHTPEPSDAHAPVRHSSAAQAAQPLRATEYRTAPSTPVRRAQTMTGRRRRGTAQGNAYITGELLKLYSPARLDL